jgi:hypothetical protein
MDSNAGGIFTHSSAESWIDSRLLYLNRFRARPNQPPERSCSNNDFGQHPKKEGLLQECFVQMPVSLDYGPLLTG